MAAGSMRTIMGLADAGCAEWKTMIVHEFAPVPAVSGAWPRRVMA